MKIAVIGAGHVGGTLAKQFGNVSKKIIIDAMNTFRGKPDPYNATAQALLALTHLQIFEATALIPSLMICKRNRKFPQ